MKAILTGQSRGLGAAIAVELLARGIPVLGLARRRSEALAERFPATLEQTEIDLADSAALLRWLAGDALRRFIDGSSTVLLINNAGIVQPVGPLHSQDPAAVAQAISVNVAAPMMLASGVAAMHRPITALRILHVSSGAARNAYPDWSVYCATKAALDQHARAVALDDNGDLRICSLAPGVIDTDMQAAIRATPVAQFPLRARFDELKQQGQLVAPADCARRLVTYLLHSRFGSTPVADLRDMGTDDDA